MPSRASKIFNKLDYDGDKSMQSTEMEEFIASQDQLWTHLSDKLKLPKVKATRAATRVAMELATGLPADMAANFPLTKEQFKQFHKDYIRREEGAEELFQRTVFACFDEDNSGELDEKELDAFLDLVYNTRDVKKGKIALYSKEEMKALVLQNLDNDGGGTLSFNEIRQVLLPDAAKRLGKLQEIHEESGEAMPDVTNRSSSSSVTKSTVVPPGGNAIAGPYMGPVPTKEGMETVQEEDDFCNWMERRLTGKSTGGLCKGCVIS